MSPMGSARPYRPMSPMGSALTAGRSRRGKSSQLAIGALAVAMLHSATHLFIPCPGSATRASNDVVTDADLRSDNVKRRSVLATLPAIAGIWTGSDARVHAAGGKKVVVFGGSGFVGSRVTDLLIKDGYAVTSVSRSSQKDQIGRMQKFVGTAPGEVTYVQLDASAADLNENSLLAGADAVISCVGIVPGGENQLAGNGAVNVRIAKAAKASGVPRFVYISVASAMSDGPGKFLFGDYMKGKAEAEAATLEQFGSANALVIKPAIIEGAGAPSGPPAPPWIKTVNVNAVAKAAIAGALGRQSGIVDGSDAIEKAAR